MAGLLKEVWLKTLLEQYRQNTNFLNKVVNLDAFVENNTINYAEAGIDPKVHKNYSTRPIPISERQDVSHNITLDTYSTETTVHPNLRATELSYDKFKSIIEGHKNALIAKELLDASHSYTPLKNSDKTPVILSTGGVKNGFKMITEEDILSMKESFDALNIPLNERVLVLNSAHYNDLLRTSELFREQIARGNSLGKIGGKLVNIWDFDIEIYTGGTLFDLTKATPEKLPQATGKTADTGISSFVFAKKEVAKASGQFKMFPTFDDTDVQGDKVNFNHRFTASPMRGLGIGAIVSSKG